MVSAVLFLAFLAIASNAVIDAQYLGTYPRYQGLSSPYLSYHPGYPGIYNPLYQGRYDPDAIVPYMDLPYYKPYGLYGYHYGYPTPSGQNYPTVYDHHIPNTVGYHHLRHFGPYGYNLPLAYNPYYNTGFDYIPYGRHLASYALINALLPPTENPVD